MKIRRNVEVLPIPAKPRRADSAGVDIAPRKSSDATREPGKAEEPKAKRSKKSGKKNELGSARGIETMFRSSYRAQLDMIALAATKANIMISVNGFILSLLIFYGTPMLDSEPLLAAPAVTFLLACLTSIIFAVLAARPAHNRCRHTKKDFKSGKANLLVFEDFASLPREEYVDAMFGMMRNKKRIYKNMTRQLHHLGAVAHAKFRMLHLSYTAFVTGLTASVLLLVAIEVLYYATTASEIVAAYAVG